MNPSGGSKPSLKLVQFKLVFQELIKLPSQAPHFGPRDEVKVLLSLWIKKCHCLHGCVICSYPILREMYRELEQNKLYINSPEGDDL